MNTFKLTTATVKNGNTITVKLQMLSSDEITAASLSVKHGTNLTLKGIALINAPDGVVINTNEKTAGEIGVLFDGSKPYPASKKYVDIAAFTFEANAVGKTNLEFTDTPTRRSVSSIDGRLLEAKWLNGAVTIKK